jgi:two-component system phosphate regulon response regulator PhoB
MIPISKFAERFLKAENDFRIILQHLGFIISVKPGKGSGHMKKIIIIEDDTILNKTLAYNLVSDGYEVDSAYTCSMAKELLKGNYHLALLDINLPDGNGLDLCTEIKEKTPETYIIFLTANDRESDMLKGYEAGGADYFTKPFSVAVLCRKIAAVFDTIEQHCPHHDLYKDGFLNIDFSEQTATLGGNPIDFTPKEYRTLLLFIKNSRLILTKTQLLEKLWDVDGNFVDEHTLTTIISRIRKKIEVDGHKYIKTAYGMGYQWIGGGWNETSKFIN